MIAVILPSRGLIFSRTAEEILRNINGMPHMIYFSHRRPIPDCFNEPVERALANENISHLWFVEDDMVIPDGTLDAMLDMDKAVVTADYPVNENGRGAVFSIKNQVIYCGTGCMLVKREVFDEIKRPYFRTNVRWRMKNFGDHIRMSSHFTDEPGYGLHDITFCMALYERGIPIHKIPKKLHQRKLVSLGVAGSNNGAHNIKIWKSVKKDQLLKTIRSWPIEKSGNLIKVDTEYGVMNVTKDHAAKLIKAGMAKKLPTKDLVVDWGGFNASPNSTR